MCRTPYRAQVPGTELVVTRTAYKNNTSKYQVDGKVKTYKEVRRTGVSDFCLL